MGVPFWAEDPDAWDRLEIDIFVFDETKVDIEGDLGNEWDVKKAAGADGAKETNKGYDPCKPKLTWTLYRLEDLSTYEALLTAVQPKPGKTAPPIISVVHPLMQMHKKEKFRIEKIHFLKYLGQQQWQAQFDLLEYFAEPKKVAKAAPPLMHTNQQNHFNAGRSDDKPSFHISAPVTVLKPIE
jgi:hypothetical protein